MSTVKFAWQVQFDKHPIPLKHNLRMSVHLKTQRYENKKNSCRRPESHCSPGSRIPLPHRVQLTVPCGSHKERHLQLAQPTPILYHTNTHKQIMRSLIDFETYVLNSNYHYHIVLQDPNVYYHILYKRGCYWKCIHLLYYTYNLQGSPHLKRDNIRFFNKSDFHYKHFLTQHLPLSHCSPGSRIPLPHPLQLKLLLVGRYPRVESHVQFVKHPTPDIQYTRTSFIQ
jgi:hypothetical protein